MTAVYLVLTLEQLYSLPVLWKSYICVPHFPDKVCEVEFILLTRFQKSNCLKWFTFKKPFSFKVIFSPKYYYLQTEYLCHLHNKLPEVDLHGLNGVTNMGFHLTDPQFFSCKDTLWFMILNDLLIWKNHRWYQWTSFNWLKYHTFLSPVQTFCLWSRFTECSEEAVKRIVIEDESTTRWTKDHRSNEKSIFNFKK